jgi:hypothetical protein
MSKVYLVYAVDISPHNFSSDWQDHRKFELVGAFLDEKNAQNHCEVLKQKQNATKIESVPLIG